VVSGQTWFRNWNGGGGYGMGAVATTFPISSSLSTIGYHQTLQTFGLIIGAVGLTAAQGLKRPPH
jgi:OFA family oxalate/formate antiporter-like MFS transporter